MASVRIALANLPYPPSPEAAVAYAEGAVADAGRAGADLVCFPEGFVPGYRSPGRTVPPPDGAFLERAWRRVAEAARAAEITVLLGSERLVADRPRLTTIVIGRDGTVLGVQDKTQIDPSEEPTYGAGDERSLFQSGALTFGVSICHEAWRYPETVRWAARRGAQVVFVPHFHEADAGSYRPSTFAEPANTFHEKALLCRAAENTCWVAAVNYASDGSPTTSAIVRPDGTVLAWQPYGEPGLLVADLDLALATGRLALRCRDY
ncbi:MAG: carbon-nitrogen hydrolase family protein [Vicinamibacterales bacterium]